VHDAHASRYDNLVRHMLVVWDALVGLAVLMWLVLRWMYGRALRALTAEDLATAREEEVDTWAETRRSAWSAQREMLKARREAFNEVAKPLEPYVFVFVVFSVPALVMSTSFCQDHSGALQDVREGASTGIGAAFID
jgi:hypothetical protein